MPALLFPNLDVLRLVLASGIVPRTITSAPAHADFDAGHRLRIRPAALPGREVLAPLLRFGVQLINTAEPVSRTCNCWAELLALKPAPGPTRNVLLFELPVADLARFTAAMRRQSRAPFGVRLPTDTDGGRAWLTCDAPPANLLLRCLERDSSVEAFAEQVPGVWVRAGWEHPLPEHLVVRAGQIVLLRPPQSVAPRTGPVPPPAFEDFSLPRIQPRVIPSAAFAAIPIRLRLLPVTETPRETVWAFAGSAADRFWEFCAGANERLLRQFEAATTAVAGETRVVVRPATGLRIPPLLPLVADGYYADPRAAGMYVPTRRAIRPALRPRELQRLLGLGPDRLTWIEAGREAEVVPRSVPVAAFVPVPDLLEYVAPFAVRFTGIGSPKEPFPLDRFAAIPVHDEQPAQEQEHPTRERLPVPRLATASEADDRPGWFARSLERLLGQFRKSSAPPRRPLDDAPAIVGDKVPKTRRKPTGPSAPARVDEKLASSDALLHGRDRAARRHELESRLLEVVPKLDSAARAEKWAELAGVYAATGKPSDAAVCWVNALWEAEPVPPAWLEHWLLAECLAARQSSPVPSLDRWLSEPGRFGAGRVVAAYAVWGARQNPPPGDLVAALPRVLAFLDQHFDDLPARAAWLARLAITGLCSGDALGLARWRDRILLRLREKGPGLDLDEPSFLRFHGTASPDRFQTAREWLVRSRKPILDWVAKLGSAGRLQWAGLDAETECTGAYAQLMLAWGLGCLGEPTRSRDWAARARKLLTRATGRGLDPDVHAVLADAFQHRIRDVQEGRPAKAAYPSDLRERIDGIGDAHLAHYAVEKLRRHSRILDPHDANRDYGGLDLRVFRGYDLLGERLQLLPNCSDPIHLGDEARQLLALCDAEPSSTTVPRVALTMLDLAPQLAESLVVPLLSLAIPAASWLENWLQGGRWTDADRARLLPRYLSRLLDKCFEAAAWFNQWPALRPTVEFLLRRAGSDPALRAAILLSAGSLFRSLRKLGYRPEAEALLNAIDPSRGDWPAGSPSFPPSQLGLAVGWFAVGDDDAGNRILDEARNRLFVSRLGFDRDRTELAIAYAEALGFAPPRIALGRLEEIFQQLDRVTVTGSTNRYFTLKPLQLIDSVVRSVVTEDFALGPAVRGWLDDDEFLIRRRIHRDIAAVLRDEGIG